MRIFLLLLILVGCASPSFCDNKVGLEKEVCEAKKKRMENDWRYERHNRRFDHFGRR